MSVFAFSRHPQVAPELAQMKQQVATYNSLCAALATTNKKKFDIESFWRTNASTVPSWAFVCRAVLANATNSCPPERVFSILNNSFDDDQDRAYADYIQLSLQLQFNNRCRS